MAFPTRSPIQNWAVVIQVLKCSRNCLIEILLRGHAHPTRLRTCKQINCKHDACHDWKVKICSRLTNIALQTSYSTFIFKSTERIPHFLEPFPNTTNAEISVNTFRFERLPRNSRRRTPFLAVYSDISRSALSTPAVRWPPPHIGSHFPKQHCPSWGLGGGLASSQLRGGGYGNQQSSSRGNPEFKTEQKRMNLQRVHRALSLGQKVWWEGESEELFLQKNMASQKEGFQPLFPSSGVKQTHDPQWK